VVRKQLFGADDPQFSGVIAWRGVIEASTLPKHLQEPKAINWVGPGAHVIHYPLERGRLINFVGAVEKQGWMVESWTERGTVEEALADYQGWHEDVHTLIRATGAPHKWAMMVRDPMPEWTRGHVTLLGDACHPTLPMLASGAAMAIEDGFIIARALEAYGDDIPEALARYEAARKDRTKRVVLGSIANTKRFHNPALAHAEGAADYVSREWTEERVKERYEWLFEYDVEKVAV
jgi:salicylate hydroxylase